jgi:hypothetical protein
LCIRLDGGVLIAGVALGGANRTSEGVSALRSTGVERCHD